MMKLFDREWSKTELLARVGHMDQLAGIQLSEGGDGKARGCRLLDVWTGTGLRFQVNAERALDITRCEYQGIPLAWHSPAGTVHPAYYEPASTGWLRSFAGGLLTTCGLDQFGVPCEDEGQYFSLHGRISHIPAAQVNYRAEWFGEEYKLEITAEIRQTALFGENLVLRRRIGTTIGTNRIQIEDRITNEGFDPTPHMLLYHFNLGFPLVSEDSELRLETIETQPRDKTAQNGLHRWNHFEKPTPGYQEQVFIHRPKTDSHGNAQIELYNPKLKLGLRWTYPTVNLPYLMEWKMMGQGAYVVGVEPANCNGLGGRAATRASGQLPILEPGETRNYDIEVEVFPA